MPNKSLMITYFAWYHRILYIRKTHLFKYTENFTSKNRKFSDKKNSDIFHISAQNIDCGYLLELPRRGSSNEYPQSMFLSKNKKNNVYPCKPQFYCIKVGFKEVKTIQACFCDEIKSLMLITLHSIVRSCKQILQTQSMYKTSVFKNIVTISILHLLL